MEAETEGCSCEPVESRDDPASGSGRLTRRRAAGSSAVSPPADSGVMDSTFAPTSHQQRPPGLPTGTFPCLSPRNPGYHPPRVLLPCVSKPGVHTFVHHTGQDVGPTRATPLTTAQGLCPHTRVFRVFEALGTHAHVAPGSVVTVLVLTRARLLCARALVYVCNRDTRLGRDVVSKHVTVARSTRSAFAPAPKARRSESDIRGESKGAEFGVSLGGRAADG